MFVWIICKHCYILCHLNVEEYREAIKQNVFFYFFSVNEFRLLYYENKYKQFFFMLF